MIPGISIIVFLKCKDSGIREASARFYFTHLLYLGLWPKGPLRVGCVGWNALGSSRVCTLMSPALLWWSRYRKNKPVLGSPQVVPRAGRVEQDTARVRLCVHACIVKTHFKILRLEANVMAWRTISANKTDKVDKSDLKRRKVKGKNQPQSRQYITPDPPDPFWRRWNPSPDTGTLTLTGWDGSLDDCDSTLLDPVATDRGLNPPSPSVKAKFWASFLKGCLFSGAGDRSKQSLISTFFHLR